MSAPSIMPTRPEVDTSVASAAQKFQRVSSIMDKMATPKTTRSKPSSNMASQHSTVMTAGFLAPRAARTAAKEVDEFLRYEAFLFKGNLDGRQVPADILLRKKLAAGIGGYNGGKLR